MKRYFCVALVAAVSIALMWSDGAFAQMGYHASRHIHVNGMHLDDQDIQELDGALGYEVPSGFYWVDFDKGVWGYEGNGETLGSIFRIDDPRRSQVNRQTPRNAPSGTTGRSQRPTVSPDAGTGSAVINPGGCSYVTAGGTTMRVC